MFNSKQPGAVLIHISYANRSLRFQQKHEFEFYISCALINGSWNLIVNIGR